MDFRKVVAPVKTGVQVMCNHLNKLDTGFRRYDGKVGFLTFQETVKEDHRKREERLLWHP